MKELTGEQIRQMNSLYRDKEEPSELFQTAYLQAITTGGVSQESVDSMLDALYDPWPDGKKDTPVDPFEENYRGERGNGLATAVVRNDRMQCINVHISERLWKMQPVGVLLRPINDRVRRAGEAIVTDVTPRSEDVESGIMPAYHYKLTIEPTPVWLAKFVGENGYKVAEAD